MTRVGHPERERTATALRRHYVDGRLDDAELSERLELVFQARTARELRQALRQLPQWNVQQTAARARHAALVGVLAVVWLMVTATIFVAFLAWIAAEGASLGALVAFPLAWLVLSLLLHRRARVSRRRLQP